MRRRFTSSLSKTIVLIAMMSLASTLGCSDQPQADQEIQEEFEASLASLNQSYGGQGKADFAGIIDPCDLLKPVQEWGDEIIRSGFFMGVYGEGTLGPGLGMGGYDVVWDFYHGQLSVSAYRGFGIDFSGGAGASAGVYAGWVGGFEHGVSDWDGYHATASTELGLPLIKEYIHLKPEVFVSAVDHNEDEIIDPSELLLPPEGVYGFSVGVGVGVELIPDPLPISFSVANGYWAPHEQGISALYHKLKRKRLLQVIGEPLAVSLVDAETGALCSESWPQDASHHEGPYQGSGHQECVIQLGRPEWSHTRNAFHVAASICALSQGCLTPLSWPQSATALAIGALRDHQESGSSLLCERSFLE